MPGLVGCLEMCVVTGALAGNSGLQKKWRTMSTKVIETRKV